MTAGLISSTKAAGDRPRVLSVAPTADASPRRSRRWTSTASRSCPSSRRGKSVGSVRENRLLAKVLGDRELLDAAVGQVMEPAFPVVDVDATSAEVTRLLRRHPAVLVEEFGRITGIITRHDMLDVPNFLGR